jgi:hypothetical protein
MATPIQQTPAVIETGASVLPDEGPREIKLISHSPLFYWWPVWAFGFFMAAWTAVEDNRFTVLPPDARIKTDKTLPDGEKTYTLSTKKPLPKPLEDSIALADQNAVDKSVFPVHVSARAWLGSLFIVILVLTIVITNVPLRGLWSFMVILGVVVISLLISVFNGWDELYERVAALRVFMNMAAYLTLATAVFIIWALATFVFDRRTYIIFSPGQIKVCEHIGSAVRTYDAAGLTFEKQRDDLFRHYILGFGSGDLIVRTAGAERHEIRLNNVLGIGWKLKPIEDLLREKPTISVQ